MSILHSSPWVVAVDKPSGLPSVPGRTPDLADCAWSRVRGVFPDALVVHRLDMATSGVLLFARGPMNQRLLSRAFASRQVHKRYVAEVLGVMAPDAGSVDLPLVADWPQRPRQRVDWAVGKWALTHFEVLSRDASRGTTRVALTPVTGRSHQLRVHMQALGHPIVGDRLYGPTSGHAADVPTDFSAMHLHAQRLQVPDPAHLAWDAPEPPEGTPTLTLTSELPAWT